MIYKSVLSATPKGKGVIAQYACNSYGDTCVWISDYPTQQYSLDFKELPDYNSLRECLAKVKLPAIAFLEVDKSSDFTVAFRTGILFSVLNAAGAIVKPISSKDWLKSCPESKSTCIDLAKHRYPSLDLKSENDYDRAVALLNLDFFIQLLET